MNSDKDKKVKQLRHNEYYDMQSTFDGLYQKSLDGNNFNKLMNYITAEENILLAFRNIKSNKGSKTPGVDGITIQEIADLPITTFLNFVRKKFSHYNPRMVKRVEIPKPNGETRPLGIPSMWDRILQQCIKQVIEPICEAKFNDHSYGFRPDRSAENALADCLKRVNLSKLTYVVDVDIKGFFDEVDHSKLMRQIWSFGVRDKQLLVIIRKMLKAPIRIDKDTIINPKKGTPQGGILSPLLANIYLNELDWWIANQWEERYVSELKKYYNKQGILDKCQSWKKLRKTTSLKEMFIVRYADDFKIFTRTRNEAKRIFHAVKLWLSDRLSLQISDEKSKITNLKKQRSEFLGFSIKAKVKGKSKGKPKFICETRVSKKAVANVQKKLKRQIKVMQRTHDSNDSYVQAHKYNSMVLGIHNYYRIATHVSNSFATPAYQLDGVIKNRLVGIRYRLKNNTNIFPSMKRYLNSSLCWEYGKSIIIPLSYIQHKNPKLRRRNTCRYTPEGRSDIHKNLSKIPNWKLNYLVKVRIDDRRTIEYYDNRIAKFVAQNGCCGITGIELVLNEMNCHHIVPWSISWDNSYNNLIWVTDTVHKLIHAVKAEVIEKYLGMLNLTKDQLAKLNVLRMKAGNISI